MILLRKSTKECINIIVINWQKYSGLTEIKLRGKIPNDPPLRQRFGGQIRRKFIPIKSGFTKNTTSKSTLTTERFLYYSSVKLIPAGWLEFFGLIPEEWWVN